MTSFASLDAVHDFSAAVLDAPTLAEAVEAALAHVVDRGFAFRAFARVQRIEGGFHELLRSQDPRDASAYEVKGLASSTVERVEQFQDEIFAPQAPADAAIAEHAQTYDMAVGSVLCVPLGNPAAMGGGLYLERGPEHAPFTEDDLYLARHFAMVLGQSCRALDRQESSHHRQEHLESLLGIFRTFSGMVELSTLLDHVTQMSLSITKAERAFVLLVDGAELTYGAGRDREAALPPVNFKRISHSVCQQVLSTRQEVCVFDAGRDADVGQRQSVVNLQLQGIVAVPLLGREGLVGILYIDSSMRNLEGLKREMKLLRALGSVASLVIENARMYQRVTVDTRTGLFTRSLLSVRMEEELTRSRRYKRPCSFLLVGIDGLDEIVETHGGDRAEVALRLASQILRTQARGGIDFPARYSDQRLALLLPETDRDGAWTLAERIRDKVSRAAFAGNGGTALSLTISVGAAVWEGPDGTATDLMAEAEAALEAALYEGGDRTVLADDLVDIEA